MQFAANFTDTETLKHVVFQNPALIVYRARCFLGMSESAQRLLGPNMSAQYIRHLGSRQYGKQQLYKQK